MRSHAYRHQRCSLCGQPLDNPLDLVVYNMDDGIITELEFRHRGACDDRRFSYSRHVQQGFADLVESWALSPYHADGQHERADAEEDPGENPVGADEGAATVGQS